MKADALARLRSIARGEAVTLATAAVTPKKPGITRVTPLRLKNDGKGKGPAEVGARSLPSPNDAEADADAIEKRAGLAPIAFQPFISTHGRGFNASGLSLSPMRNGGSRSMTRGCFSTPGGTMQPI
jgi:hypothetical protein